jgi:CBS domain-containing protein
MLARLALLAVLLLVAATASANPLIGVWRSDRDLTLLEMEKLATLTLEQREVLSTPDLFGRLVAIYGDREIEFRLAEGSTRLSYRIVATGSDFVEIEYDDEQAAEPVRKRLLLYGGLLHVPVEDKGFHEVFRRIDAPAALAP